MRTKGGSLPTGSGSLEDWQHRQTKRMFDILIQTASERLEHQPGDDHLQHRNWVFVGWVGSERTGGSHREDARDSEKRTGGYSECSRAVHSG